MGNISHWSKSWLFKVTTLAGYQYQNFKHCNLLTHLYVGKRETWMWNSLHVAVKEKVEDIDSLLLLLGSSFYSSSGLVARVFTLQINLPRSRNEMVSLKYSASFSKFPFLSSGISAHLFIVKDEMSTLWYVINVEYEVQILFGKRTSQRIHSFLTKRYFLNHSFKVLFPKICCINI